MNKEFFVMFEVKSKRKEKIRRQTYPRKSNQSSKQRAYSRTRVFSIY